MTKDTVDSTQTRLLFKKTQPADSRGLTTLQRTRVQFTSKAPSTLEIGQAAGPPTTLHGSDRYTPHLSRKDQVAPHMALTLGHTPSPRVRYRWALYPRCRSKARANLLFCSPTVGPSTLVHLLPEETAPGLLAHGVQLQRHRTIWSRASPELLSGTRVRLGDLIPRGKGCDPGLGAREGPSDPCGSDDGCICATEGRWRGPLGCPRGVTTE